MISNPLYYYKVKVTRVVDGDTFHGLIDLGFHITLDETFRLAGVDTPETWRPRNAAERAHGKEATAFAKNLLEGQTVICKSVANGKYGRYIVKVYLTDGDLSEDRTLSDMLIEGGFAKRDTY